MSNFFLQNKPFIVPTNDGKLIEEHFRNANTQHTNISIARMAAPPGWSEPFQCPEFDEWTLVNRGRKMVEIEGEQIIVNPGHSILIKKGTHVRYSNPFEEACEYWSVCMPAFSIEAVNRE